jgi:hypothetical protein
MATSYNYHFAKYSKEKKNVTQLIPTFVWKAIYAKYRETYPNNIFQENTLKDRLQDALKKLKIGTLMRMEMRKWYYNKMKKS